MFSSPIGLKAINKGSAFQDTGGQAPQGVDARVHAIGKGLRPSTCRNKPRVESSRSFSHQRFLWCAILLVGARAQQTTPFPAAMNLSSLTGTNGFVLNGEQAGDSSGISVASAGDVNGDGVADLVIGASNASASAGKTYVVFGRTGLGSSGSIALGSLNGTNGFVLNGEQANDYSGNPAASAGDVNGDGIADLLMGAYHVNNNAGKSYVVLGRAGLGSSGSLAFSSLNGTSGFVLNGYEPDDFSGNSVASAGDVNDDGINDFLIGANGANSYAGKSYVIFGRAGLGSSGSLALSSLNGTNGFVLNGEQANDRSGHSVSSAGDVNGDGIADLVIGAYGANSGAGKSYVIFGRVGLGSSGSLALSSLNGTNGFVLNGEQKSDQSGFSVASAGDVNDDGIADLLIGANGANSYAGKSYVVYGVVSLGSSGSFALSSLNGTNGFVLNGEQTSDQSGFSVASARDVNDDGIADLVIGANGANSYAGKSYVVFGRKLSNATFLTTPPPTPRSITTALSTSSQISSLTPPQANPASSTANSPISTQLTLRGSVSFTNTLSNGSPFITLPPLNSNPSQASLPLIIGLASAVAVLVCSLIAGGLFYFRRKRNTKNSIEHGTKAPANYTSIEAIHQGMASSRANDQYINLPGAKPEGHYSDPYSVQQPTNGEQYDHVSLAQLNAEANQHGKAQLKPDHSNYSDIALPH